MDDNRLANLLFLAGIATLGVPGCGDVGEPGEGPGGGPPGNPLASESSLGGVDSLEVCGAYVTRIAECSGGFGGYDYDTGYYGVSIAPDFADYCARYIADLGVYAGPECASATVEIYACLSGLSCDVLVLGADFACREALVAADAACNVGGGVGEDDRE
ncbi:MAG: hypothetical protein ACRBN8_01365 [Nannocystales bacterium]